MWFRRKEQPKVKEVMTSSDRKFQEKKRIFVESGVPYYTVGSRTEETPRREIIGRLIKEKLRGEGKYIKEHLREDVTSATSTISRETGPNIERALTGIGRSVITYRPRLARLPYSYSDLREVSTRQKRKLFI